MHAMDDATSRGTESSRWSKMIEDVFGMDARRHDPVLDWPDPGYALAAEACGTDREALSKLRRLCEDLECVVDLTPTPGSFARLAGVPLDTLAALGGRCWREILLDASLPVNAWRGIARFGAALKAREMDAGTRRCGAVLHATAIARLEALGFYEKGARFREISQTERRALLEKPYLPPQVAQILSSSRSQTFDS